MTKKNEKQASGRGGYRPGGGSKAGVPRGPYKKVEDVLSRKINTAITEATWVRLEALSKELGIRSSDLVRQAIDEHLKRLDKASKVKHKKP